MVRQTPSGLEIESDWVSVEVVVPLEVTELDMDFSNYPTATFSVLHLI